MGNKKGKPMMVVCRTLKGKGLGPKVEDNLNMHGKPMGANSDEAIQLIRA